MGVGVGLIFRSRASSEGSDVIASILKIYPNSSGHSIDDRGFSYCYLRVLVFQVGSPLYSWLTIFLMGRVIDTVVHGFSDDKTVLIISKRAEIRLAIINDLKGNHIQSSGNVPSQRKGSTLHCCQSERDERSGSLHLRY